MHSAMPINRKSEDEGEVGSQLERDYNENEEGRLLFSLFRFLKKFHVAVE